jgi:hypothetical protein
MQVEIVVKEFNDSYEDFEMKVNRQLYFWIKEYKEIKDVNILHDGKSLIAIIKYI